MSTSSFWGPFTQQPNILILMTDQQRTTQHYPAGWAEKNLPNLTQLQNTGVTFPNAMTNTTACSPSRSVLFTSTYPTLNGVIEVGSLLKMGQDITLPNQQPLPLDTLGGIMQNASLLPAGITYQVAYKGKWHLDGNYESGLSETEQQNDAATLQQNDDDMDSTYHFPGWTSPDFGTAMKFGPVSPGDSSLYTLGAGVGQNDARVTNGTSYPTGSDDDPGVQNAVDFLNQYAPNQDGTNPFFLVVSLLNPHDIWVYPDSVESAGFTTDDNGKYPWQYPPFTDITTPPSYDLSQDQLDNKPSIQGGVWRPGHDQNWGPDVATEYAQFYAYLETLTDALLGEVVTALTQNPNNLTDNTLIIRLADHGEMAMAQGGMREKEHQVYNETLLVPMTFSNPGLPQGETCTGLAGLIDIIPTIATVTGIDVNTLDTTYPIQGTTLDEAILNAGSSTDSTYNEFLFATDDAGAHIRCLIEDENYNAKYAVYYKATGVLSGSNPNGTASDFQYEMYDFSYDTGTTPPTRDAEESNLIPVNGYTDPLSDPSIQTTWHNMHVALTSQLEAKEQKPDDWPDPPPLPESS